MPRLGVIRLGIKVKAGSKEVPQATDYFVVPDEVKAVYGDKPKSLDIMFPTNDLDQVFPCWYKRYGDQWGLICRGDGEAANLSLDYLKSFPHNEYGVVARDGSYYIGDLEVPVVTDSTLAGRAWVRIPCQGTRCPLAAANKCGPVGQLNVFLPKVIGVLGVYTIKTSGRDSIQNIIGGATALQTIASGRLAMIGLKLSVKMEEKHPLLKDGKRIKTVVPVLHVDMGCSLEQLMPQIKEVAALEKGTGSVRPLFPELPESTEGEGESDNATPTAVEAAPAQETISEAPHATLVGNEAKAGTSAPAKKAAAEAEGRSRAKADAGPEAEPEAESQPKNQPASEATAARPKGNAEPTVPEQITFSEADDEDPFADLGQEIEPFAVLKVLTTPVPQKSSRSKAHDTVFFRAVCIDSNGLPQVVKGSQYKCYTTPNDTSLMDLQTKCSVNDLIEITLDTGIATAPDLLILKTYKKRREEEGRKAA
jgi:hypothetical protein